MVSMGPEQASESLRTALALGADRAVLVCDPAAAGSDLVATSKVLAKALEREEADLVLFGQQTSDGAAACCGRRWRSGWACPSCPRPPSSPCRAPVSGSTRQTEFGDDVIEVPLPAVVAVSDAINEPRYTSLKGRMGAKKKPLEMLALADLGLDASEAGEAGSRTAVLRRGRAARPGQLDQGRGRGHARPR